MLYLNDQPTISAARGIAPEKEPETLKEQIQKKLFDREQKTSEMQIHERFYRLESEMGFVCAELCDQIESLKAEIASLKEAKDCTDGSVG
jgi:hypothetical protein